MVTYHQKNQEISNGKNIIRILAVLGNILGFYCLSFVPQKPVSYPKNGYSTPTGTVL